MVISKRDRNFLFPESLLVLGIFTGGWLFSTAGAGGAQSAPPRLSPDAQLVAQASTDSWYTLGAGDRIHLEVFDAPEYTGEHQILPDGSISLPLVGAVRLQGLTLDQASDRLSERLAPILRRPLATVRLLEARALTLSVSGEVNRPGAYTLSLEDADSVPTVTQAIQLAGGITQSADIRNVQVVRVNPTTQAPQGVLVANLWQLLQEGDLQQDRALRDGDRIVVPPATSLDLNETTDLAAANFSPATIPVNVVGEVGDPGTIQVPPHTPLNQAILAAGGFNNRARKGRVELVRLHANGTVSQEEIEVDLAQDVNHTTNPPLRPYDTIIVNRSTFTRITDQVGRALGPFTGFFSFLRIFGL
ncbi:MAG: SLBB domain-containing protein [Synechococcales bacterium]|nr:SLBB domain-containing protein [Synechococcales bacterium]